MRFTLQFRDETTTLVVEHALPLGGDPRVAMVMPNRTGPWHGRFQPRAEGWVFDLAPGSEPATTLNGEVIAGDRLHPIAMGDVIAAGEVAIIMGYAVTELPPAEPLSALERELLANVARDPGDAPRRVLADLWQEGIDDARGTLVHAQCEGLDLAHQLMLAHGPRWCEHAVLAGFRPADLELERGFAPALVLGRREALAHSPDAWRLSPVHYFATRQVQEGLATDLFEGVRVTTAGETGVVAIKLPTTEHPEAAYVIDREHQILRRFDSPHLPKVRDLAASRPGRALVLDWAGQSLDELLGEARPMRRPPGEAVAIAIGIQLCRALAVAHDAGVAHTEVAPDHVLIDERGHVTLCDFGFASCDLKKPAQPSEPRRIRARFRFMSPEQILGRTLGPATDVFSLAMLLAELVAGEHPLGSAPLTDFETIDRIRRLQFTVPETRSTLGRKLSSLLVREPEHRRPAALLGLELARIAEVANLQVGPATLADFVRASRA